MLKGLSSFAATFLFLAAAAFLPGCIPSDGELTAEELTEVEKETLDSLAKELEEIEDAQQETEEEFYEEVAEYNEKIRVQRHESIARHEEIVKEAELTQVLARVLKFLSFRPRSEKEVTDWFLRKEVGFKTQALIRRKLKKQKLLDDKEFSRWWLEQRILFLEVLFAPRVDFQGQHRKPPHPNPPPLRGRE